MLHSMKVEKKNNRPPGCIIAHNFAVLLAHHVAIAALFVAVAVAADHRVSTLAAK